MVRIVGFGHIAWLGGIAFIAAFLARLCRQAPKYQPPVRFALGAALASEEMFRYWHDGIHFPNQLPLHLCTVALWMAVVACFTSAGPAVEFAYFVGLPASVLALLMPDLRAPWYSYNSIRYFFEHGLLAIAITVLILGKIAPLKSGAALRANFELLAYAILLLTFNTIFATNYMYLRHKPSNPSLLDYFGPWPVYLFAGELFAVAVFWLLWLPVRPVMDRTKLALDSPATLGVDL